MENWAALLGLVWIALAGVGVIGAPREHLVRRLPGQPKVPFKQYAGYVTVDEVAGTALFYYFVEARHNATSMPLALWLNGGPGCSSIGGGAFTELGPFYPNGRGTGLRRNYHSWNKAANLLFLDSPAGVGWSYSNTTSAYNYDDKRVGMFTHCDSFRGLTRYNPCFKLKMPFILENICATFEGSTLSHRQSSPSLHFDLAYWCHYYTANETVTFLLKWFQKFPEYRTSDLFLTGESYAGHYIPHLAALMLSYNKNPAMFPFNLKAITIGNPLLNYGVDTSATYFFLWSHGLISDQTYEGVTSSCDFSDGLADDDAQNSPLDDQNPGSACPDFVGAAHSEIGGNINLYDVTLDVCPPPIVQQALRLRKLMTHSVDGIDVCIDDEITSYFNSRRVQDALHANVTGLPYAWEACSGVVEYKFEDQLENMIPIVGDLIKQGLRVWIFSGDQDSVVPLSGTRTQIGKLALELRLRTIRPYSAWYAGGQVGGWTQVYEGLVYATVRGAAHMVPYAQPERAFILFRRFLAGKPLPRHSY